jgi:hypothetical protein
MKTKAEEGRDDQIWKGRNKERRLQEIKKIIK